MNGRMQLGVRVSLAVTFWLVLSSWCGAQVQDWDAVRARLEVVTTDSGRQEVAKEIGLATLVKNHDDFSLGVESVDFILDIAKGADLGKYKAVVETFVTGWDTFGGAMERFGAAMIIVEMIHDFRQNKTTPQIVNNYFKNSSFFLASVSGIPVVQFVFLGTKIFKFFGDKAADAVYTADEEIWWPVYEDYFLKDHGQLKPKDWVALFKNGDQAEYVAHMDRFFTEEGHEYAIERFAEEARKGKKNPSVGDPQKLAVQKLAEAFRIRYFNKHLQNQLGEWALQEARAQVEREKENVRQAILALIQKSLLRVRVIDQKDGYGVRDAEVEITWSQGKTTERQSGKTSKDGLMELHGVPPWADGPLTVAAPGYVFWKETKNADFFSSVDKPREQKIEIVPIGVTFKALVIDSQSGKAVAGARVSAGTPFRGSPVEGTTGGDGIVSLALNKAGELAFTVSATGFAKIEETRTVDIVPGKEVHEEVFRLSPEGGVTVGILVRDAKTSKPIPGVQVTCTLGTKTERAATDGGGKASIVFDGGSAETVKIILTHDGYVSKTLSEKVEKGMAQAFADLEPDSVKVVVTVKEAPKGSPSAGAKIAVTPGDGKGATGADGTAEIVVPAADEFVVTCTKKGFPPAKATAEVKDCIARVTILLAEKMATLNASIGNKANNKPLKGVKVRAVVDGVECSGETDAEGNLKMEIPLGQIAKFYLSKKGFKTVELTKKIVDGKVSIGGTLAPDGAAIIALTLKDRASGKLLKGVKVVVGGKSAVSGKDGVAQLEAPPEQDVMIRASLQGYQERNESGAAPPAGDVMKIGWYLDPIGQPDPKPQEPAPERKHGSPSGGTFTRTVTDAGVTISVTVSGVIVEKVIENKGKIALEGRVLGPEVFTLNGARVRKENKSRVTVSGSISYSVSPMKGKDFPCSFVGGAYVRNNYETLKGNQIDKMTEPSKHPISGSVPFDFSVQPFSKTKVEFSAYGKASKNIYNYDEASFSGSFEGWSGDHEMYQPGK